MMFYIWAFALFGVSTLLIMGTSPYLLAESPVYERRRLRRNVAMFLYIAATFSLVMGIMCQTCSGNS